MIQAVRAGIGIGLVPRILVVDELANSELISLDLPFASQRSYYLVYPPRNEMLPSLVAFRTWLLTQI
ncbi:DNA-binding transcriptional activator GcvA [compost metagenome]